MAQINVVIDGTAYRMACDDGQEAHLESLATRFDTTLKTLRASFGDVGDQRLTVMAGIMMVDELSEAEQKIEALHEELESMKAARSAVIERYQTAEEAASRTIGDTALRLSKAADKLTKNE